VETALIRLLSFIADAAIKKDASIVHSQSAPVEFTPLRSKEKR
jgi:hypothetical protein